MKLDTPYRDRPAGERDRERLCMAHVLGAVPEHPRTVFEAFGGIGMTASLMGRMWPEAEILSTELDEHCVELYRAVAPLNCRVIHGDCLDALCTPSFYPDLVSLDFNQFTLKSADDPFQSQVLARSLDLHPKWIQLTDSAVGKLHLNHARYGLPTRDLRTYLDTLADKLGLYIRAAAAHSAASYLLLSRNPQPEFEIKIVRPQK